MINNNPAPSHNPILEAIKNRWSPLAFSNEKISEQELNTLLEAAHWAPSAFNEQPWQYIIGHNEDENFKKIANSLAEGNSWAKNAGLLMISLANKNFIYNDKFNKHHLHDLGAATALMFLQATEMNLYMHEMAGFDEEKIRKDFNIPNNIEIGAAIAIGKPGNKNNLTEEQRKREESPRKRKEIQEIIWK